MLFCGYALYNISTCCIVLYYMIMVYYIILHHTVLLYYIILYDMLLYHTILSNLFFAQPEGLKTTPPGLRRREVPSAASAAGSRHDLPAAALHQEALGELWRAFRGRLSRLGTNSTTHTNKRACELLRCFSSTLKYTSGISASSLGCLFQR